MTVNSCTWMVVTPVKPVVFQQRNRLQALSSSVTRNRTASEIPVVSTAVYQTPIRSLGLFEKFKLRSLKLTDEGANRLTIRPDHQQNGRAPDAILDGRLAKNRGSGIGACGAREFDTHHHIAIFHPIL